MNFNLTTVFGYSLQFTIGYFEPKTEEFTLIGLNLIQKRSK